MKCHLQMMRNIRYSPCHMPSLYFVSSTDDRSFNLLLQAEQQQQQQKQQQQKQQQKQRQQKQRQQQEDTSDEEMFDADEYLQPLSCEQADGTCPPQCSMPQCPHDASGLHADLVAVCMSRRLEDLVSVVHALKAVFMKLHLLCHSTIS